VTFPLVAAAALLLFGSFLVIRTLIEADRDVPIVREAPEAALHIPEHRKAA